jgi:hypothetical protein
MGLALMDLNNVTIAIPLHKSLEFSEIIVGNIERLASHCKIIISDCTEEDNLLKDLENKYREIQNVRTIGKRNMGKGWINHWNDLMNEVHTEYFMWLSHDDEIDLNWVSENLQNLQKNPQLAGSFGLLYTYLENGKLVENCVRFPSIIKDNRKFLANSLIENWNLGIATRAVWTKSKVLPILNTQEPNDEWGDIVWIYGILLDYKISQISNVSYRKRLYIGSAHSCWRPFDLTLSKKLLLREIVRRGLSLEISEELSEICDDRLIHQKAEVLLELDHMHDQWDQLMNSKFWRITTPIRALMKFMKGFIK